jgi:hypothetical protein
MSASPYREPGRVPRRRSPRAAVFGDLSLLVAFGVFWAVSVARVAGALARHEIFGGESTLALMAVIGLPILLFGRRAQSSVTHHDSRPAP